MSEAAAYGHRSAEMHFRFRCYRTPTTCAQQRPILAKLEAEPKYDGLVVYDVDFDSQKDVVRAFGVQMQSTLIAFHGKTEEARSTGETSPEAIQALVAKTQG